MSKRPQQSKAAVVRCIDAYYVAFVRKFNTRTIADAWLKDKSVPKEQVVLPMIHGAKDGALIKKMVAAWGEERVLALCEQFPSMTDARVLRSDYSIGAMFSLAQHLMLRQHKPADDQTARNVDAVSRAVGRGQQ